MAHNMELYMTVCLDLGSCIQHHEDNRSTTSIKSDEGMKSTLA